MPAGRPRASRRVLLGFDEILHLIGMNFGKAGEIVRRGGFDVLFPGEILAADGSGSKYKNIL